MVNILNINSSFNFSGLLGPIISAIQKKGFEITGLRLVLLDRSAAEEFLEIYCTILPEYPAMVTQLCSGSCVAIEISGKDENIPTLFRFVESPCIGLQLV